MLVSSRLPSSNTTPQPPHARKPTTTTHTAPVQRLQPNYIPSPHLRQLQTQHLQRIHHQHQQAMREQQQPSKPVTYQQFKQEDPQQQQRKQAKRIENIHMHQRQQQRLQQQQAIALQQRAMRQQLQQEQAIQQDQMRLSAQAQAQAQNVIRQQKDGHFFQQQANPASQANLMQYQQQQQQQQQQLPQQSMWGYSPQQQLAATMAPFSGAMYPFPHGMPMQQNPLLMYGLGNPGQLPGTQPRMPGMPGYPRNMLGAHPMYPSMAPQLMTGTIPMPPTAPVHMSSHMNGVYLPSKTMLPTSSPRLSVEFQVQGGVMVADKCIQGGRQPDMALTIKSNFDWRDAVLRLVRVDDSKEVSFKIETSYGCKVWSKPQYKANLSRWLQKPHTKVRVQFCEGYFGVRVHFVVSVRKLNIEACTKKKIVVRGQKQRGKRIRRTRKATRPEVSSSPAAVQVLPQDHSGTPSVRVQAQTMSQNHGVADGALRHAVKVEADPSISVAAGGAAAGAAVALRAPITMPSQGRATPASCKVCPTTAVIANATTAAAAMLAPPKTITTKVVESTGKIAQEPATQQVATTTTAGVAKVLPSSPSLCTKDKMPVPKSSDNLLAPVKRKSPDAPTVPSVAASSPAASATPSLASAAVKTPSPAPATDAVPPTKVSRVDQH